MFFALISALAGLASAAMPMSNPCCNVPYPGLNANNLQPSMPFIPFPPLQTVRVVDMLIEGALTIAYRAKLSQRVTQPGDRRAVIINCKGDSSCRKSSLPSLQCYLAAVSAIMENAKQRCASNNTARAQQVATAIYKAAAANCSDVCDLIVFTAIAMHNMYMFSQFTQPNCCNTDLCLSRGLLQVRGEQYYRMLSSFGNENYVERPCLLDYFSNASIAAEYKLFTKCFKGASKNCLLRLAQTVWNMRPCEVIGKPVPTEETVAQDMSKSPQLANRREIYNMLYCFLVKNKK